MAIATQIEVKTSGLDLNKLLHALRPERIASAAGRAVSNRLRKHLESLDRSRGNKLGGPRSHFYNQVAASIETDESQINAGEVRLTIPHVGFRLRLLGGTVKPGVNTSRTTGAPTKYLTIPAIPEAYGKRAGEFDGKLRLRLRRIGGAVRAVGLEERLASDDTPAGKGKKNAREGKTERKLYFKLVKSATHKADPTVLPTEDELLTAGEEAIRKLIDILGRQQAKGNLR